jgi:PrcB C-terminal
VWSAGRRVAELYDGLLIALPPPEIDFAREMIIVAASGLQPSSGYDVFVETASDTTSGTNVVIRSVSPGGDCTVATVLTAPVDIVRLPRRDGPVIFDERSRIELCRMLPPTICPTLAPAPHWVCTDGGWVPPDHPLAGNSATRSPVPPPKNCVTTQPAPGWLCLEGGWIPPDYPPGAGEPMRVVRLRSGSAPYTDTQIRAPERIVVRNQAEWRSAWVSISGGYAPLPAIDFTREMIVVAALGQRPSSGYGIFVDAASESTSGVTVGIRSVSPAADCGPDYSGGVFTAPVDIARLPRRDGPVVFEERAEIRSCRPQF